MRAAGWTAIAVASVAAIADAAYFKLRPSEVKVDVTGPNTIAVSGSLQGICGENIQNAGTSFSLKDVVMPMTVYLNDTHDTSEFLKFDANIKGSGKLSVNSTNWCNMKVKFTGTGTYPNADRLPYKTYSSDDAIMSTEFPQVTQINDTDGKTVLQVQYNPAGEGQTGYTFGSGTWHYDITDENVELPGIAGMEASYAVRNDYVGMALEWASAIQMFRKPGSTTEVNPNVAQLLSYLQHIHILVNGNTGMLTYLPDSALPKLERSEYPTGTEDFQFLNNIAAADGATLVLGAPMLSPDPRYTADFVVNGILKNMESKNLYAIELGNEPDHWAIIAKKSFRTIPYTYEAYKQEYLAAQSLILQNWPAGVPKVPLQGPAIAGCNTFAGKQCWQDNLLNFAQTTGPETKYISFHRYGNSGCSKYTNARTLLSDPDWNSGDFEFIARLSPQIRALGKELVWGEGNALSCGGKDGVSNSFAATLWILDNLFEAAVRGVSSMNVHADPTHLYSPYMVSASGAVTVLPVYYGMLQFHRLFDSVSMKVFRPKTSVRSRWIKVWGTRDTGTGKIRVVIINKDLQSNDPLNVGITVPGGNSGVITRLRAPSYESSRGITIAGQTFDGSTDGKIRGSYKSENIRRNADGTFTVTVPPVSAAILEISA